MEGPNTASASSCIQTLIISKHAALPTILVLICLFMTCCASPMTIHDKKTTLFIKTSCRATQYPSFCLKSLSTIKRTSPKQLAHAALSASLKEARSASSIMSKMAAQGGMRPGETTAMDVCLEMVADSVDELRRSMGEMGRLTGREFELRKENIMTWVSAALTDENTCMDAFEGVEGAVKEDVRSRVVKVAKLISNALALVNNLAS